MEIPKTRWARTIDGAYIAYQDFGEGPITHLEAGGVTELSLDHDLGDEREVGSGYDVLLWIEERAARDETYIPPVIHVHSSNIVARERMERAVASIERIVGRRA